MKQIISEYFYDPIKGYKSPQRLYETMKDDGIDVTLTMIKEFYEKQQVNQLFKQAPKITGKIVCQYNSVGCLQMDLMEIRQFSRQNSGFKYLLNVIDLFSRYAWSFPTKTKTPAEIVKPLKEIMNDLYTKYPHNHFTVTSDNGNEFLGPVRKLFLDNDFQIYYNNPEAANAKTRMGMIERFNGTIWNYIKKYTSSIGKLRFLDKISDFVSNYNNTRHSSTGLKPIDIFEKRDIPAATEFSRQEKLTVGDKVRTLLKRKTFDKKGFLSRWTETVRTIETVEKNRYYLKGIKRSYIRRELQKIDVSENPTIIEPVISRNTRRTRTNRLQRNIGVVGHEVERIEDDGTIVYKERLRPVNKKRIRNKPTRFD